MRGVDITVQNSRVGGFEFELTKLSLFEMILTNRLSIRNTWGDDIRNRTTEKIHFFSDEQV